MEYRRVGRSGLKTSAIALGSWLTYGTATEREAARACIRRALELGINHFDCADVYGERPGAAEEFLGEALKDVPRHSYILTTKCFWPVGDGPNDRGLSRKHIFESVNRSLRRLGTDYIDIMYCHRFDPETPVDETLRALDDLVRQGKVLYIGISEWTAAQIAEGLRVVDRYGLHPITVNQPVYNMLERKIEPEILPLCAREGIGLVVFSPLAQGVLTGKYRPGQAPPPGSRGADPKVNRWVQSMIEKGWPERVEKLRPIAADLGITLAQLALAWVLRRPEVSAALIGASRPEQLDENVKALEVKLGEAELKAIDEALGMAQPAEA